MTLRRQTPRDRANAGFAVGAVVASLSGATCFLMAVLLPVLGR